MSSWNQRVSPSPGGEYQAADALVVDDEVPSGSAMRRAGHRGAEDVTDLDIKIYQHAVRNSGIHRDEVSNRFSVTPDAASAACDRLLRFRLLSGGQESGVLVPVHPDVAGAQLNEQLSNEIRDLERTIEQNAHQLRRINDALAETALPHDGEGIRVVESPLVLRRETAAAILRCTGELLSTHPGSQADAHQFRQATNADIAMLTRDVKRKVLYQHSARSNLGIRASVARISENGGQVRTTPDSLDSILIFDRQVAFVCFAEPGKAPPGSCAIISHPFMVSFICHMFERLWSSAMNWEPDIPATETASAETTIALLRLMASGLKDEVIAHRMGVAPRTCRRHMASVMGALGATSRIQAGVKIAQLGVLAPDREAKSGRTRWVDAHPMS
jgi:DNA-binding CsgD family transcriptional regulator